MPKLRVTFTINRDNTAGIHHGNIESKMSGARPVTGKNAHFYIELDGIPQELPKDIASHVTVVECILTDSDVKCQAPTGRYSSVGTYEAEVTPAKNGKGRNIRISKTTNLKLIRAVHGQLMEGAVRPSTTYAM